MQLESQAFKSSDTQHSAHDNRQNAAARHQYDKAGASRAEKGRSVTAETSSGKQVGHVGPPGWQLLVCPVGRDVNDTSEDAVLKQNKSYDKDAERLTQRLQHVVRGKAVVHQGRWDEVAAALWCTQEGQHRMR